MSKRKATNWNYPTSIWFGHERTKDIVKACEHLNIKNPLIVTDEALVNLPIIEDLKNPLKNENIAFTLFSDVQSNPSAKNVEDGVKVFNENACDGVIAFGGGSALDAGKTIAFMSGQSLSIWDFEDVGDNFLRANIEGIAPIIAIPTTSGTGSEVGRASVITNSETHAKKIIFHPLMLPSLVILDPNLTYGLPKHITAWTGIDALVHSLEAYFAPGFHPMADGIALEAISLIKNNLVPAYENGNNENARANMLVAAMMGATAFQKGLGSVHSIAHQLGGLFNTPHGLANSIILPYALRQNKSAIQDKMKKLCVFLDIENPSLDSFIAYIIDLRQTLGIPSNLSEAKISDDRADEIGVLAYADPSTASNAKKLEIEDLTVLFKAAHSGNYDLLKDY
ncbi:MAG: iron-containing alcohol dehydrogenase [Campylobacteraceae bacterium]|nr:iron-containing alcohol dehydrogenase [Campylobacteraceae bacterium]